MTRPQARTAITLAVAAILLPLAAGVGALTLEMQTLANEAPGDHITEVLRVIALEQPWVYVIAAVWFGFWLIVAGIVAGHAFYGPLKERR